MNIDLMRVIDRAFGIPAVGFLSAFRSPLPSRKHRRALVIKLFGLGNIVMLVPAVHLLKSAFPGLQVDLLTFATNSGVASMYRRYFSRAHLLRYSAGGMAKDLGEFLARYRGAYDLVIDAEQFIRLAAIVALLLRPRAIAGIPTVTCRKQRACSVWIPYQEDRPLVQEYLDLASAIARTAGHTPNVPPSLLPPETDAASERRVEELFQDIPAESLRVGVCVGGRSDAMHKRYPLDSWNQLLKKLSEAHSRIYFVFTGTAGEAVDVRAAEAGLPRTMDISGQLTQLELVEVLRRLDVVLSNDTGTIHLAAALGKWCVGFYGPTDPNVYGPYTQRRLILRDPRNANQITNVREKSNEGLPVYWPTPEEAFGKIQGLLKTM